MRAEINLYNSDCMEAMREMDENQFELAIVDPPYGIGESSKNFSSRSVLANSNKYTVKDWDNQTPDGFYFSELKRVSKNQIIWGWNYFVAYLNECPSYIVWNKKNGANDFADCESAWCSKKGAARVFEYKWHGMLQENMKEKEVRIHPTQKPVQLYKWLLKNYAKEGDKILDTHLGSGSIALACWDMKHDLTAFEIDAEYYEAAKKRLEQHTSQGQLF